MVSSASVENVAGLINSTPHDHFTASPDSCGILPRSGRAGGAGGCPTVRARVVSPAGVVDRSTPDDHFAASRDRRVILSAAGCVGGACSGPTVRAGIVSPAGVQIVSAVISAPDD